MDKNNFNSWFLENWEQAGGLIRPAEAARMLGVSRPAIHKAMKSNNLPTYSHIEAGRFTSLEKTLFLIAKKADKAASQKDEK